MTDLYTASTDSLSDAILFKELFEKVPLYRQEKIRSLRFEKDKRLCLGAWLVLMRALSERGISDQAPALSYNSYGKPFLSDYPNVFFNLSHSGNRVMCAVSDFEVGCDVETLSPFRPALAKRFFSPHEYDAVMSAPEDMRNDLFLRYWTLKESFIKNAGLGMSLPLQSFCIRLDSETISVDQSALSLDSFFFYEYQWNGGYRGALCAREKTISDIQEIAFE